MAATIDKQTSDSGRMVGAVQGPALRLQSDSRLAELGLDGSPVAFETIMHRYRRPLIKHCSELVGREQAGKIVDQTFAQARALFGDDPRSREPGPWLYWMAHNMAIADLRRSSLTNGSANGHANGSATVAAAGNGAAHSNGSGNGHVSGSVNGDASNGSGAAFETLTFSEGARVFSHDAQTKRMVSGTRVRMRNTIGHLVPSSILEAKPAAAAAGTGGGSVATGTVSGGTHNLRAALVIFGACFVACLVAFLYDGATNKDVDDLRAAGGVPAVPGAPNGGDVQGLLDNLGKDGAAPAVPPTAAPDTGTTPPAGTTAPPASTTQQPSDGSGEPLTPNSTTPPPAGEATPEGAAPATPPADNAGQGFAGVLTAFGVKNAAALPNPVSMLLGLIGIPISSSSTQVAPPIKPPKAPKVPKPSAGGSTPPVVPPAASAPTPPVIPPKPTLPPLGNAGPTISYTAAKGRANDITVSKVGKKFRITDRGVKNIPVSTGCRSTRASGNSKSQVCLVKGVDRFDFKLGNKDDTLDLRTVKPASIAGESGDDVLTGGGGADSIDGGRGNDSLVGEGGRDTITGDVGEDQIQGAAGNDVLSGGDGDDEIDGGKGNDSIETGSGDDSVRAQDGEADQIDCGSGNDTVWADPIDTVASDCERVNR